eukprot:603093-Rhodomonas_salina.1
MRIKGCTAAFLCLTFCATVSPFTHAPTPWSPFARAALERAAQMGSAGRLVAGHPTLGARVLVGSTVENAAAEKHTAILRKPRVDPELAQLAQKPTPRMRREVVESIYQTLDINGDGSISKEEFLDGMHGVDFAASEEASAELFAADQDTIS